MSLVYMLDTNICSFIMRERPRVSLERLQAAVEAQDSIVISVITYYEMLLGVIGRNASPRHAALVQAFVARLSAILPWDRTSAEEAMRVQRELMAKGAPIGGNDTMIAGHALAAECVPRHQQGARVFSVARLRVEDWTAAR